MLISSVRMKVLLYCILAVLTSESLAQRGRRCCRYSGSCSSRQSCVFTDLSSPSDSECSVIEDSKSDSSSFNSFECNHRVYSSSHSLNHSSFRLSSYIFSSRAQQVIPALDLQIAYTPIWDKARFRFMNLDGSSTSRCVDIERDSTMESSTVGPSNSYLSYDCEAGFYVGGNHKMIYTAGHTYQLDICLLSHSEEKCGSYLFTMPSIQQINQNPTLTLIDRQLLMDDHSISLHSSTKKGLRLAMFVGESPKKLLYEYNYTEDQIVSFPQLPPGNYTISGSSLLSSSEMSKWTQIAQFRVVESNFIMYKQILYIFIGICGFIVVIATCFYTVNVFKIKDKYFSLSNDSMKKGAKDLLSDVYIISNVDNQDHSEILVHLSRYLEAQTGIGKVIYAMDPENGITSHENHDPWRWAQEVIDNMDCTNDYIVFSASPSSESCNNLYENLYDNQTLLSTQYLSKMVEGNRVSIIEFPYTEPSSISPLVPKDIPKIPKFTLPTQMEDFIEHIQNPPKTGLISKLSRDILHNEVDFVDVRDLEESSILVYKINALSYKTKKLSLKDKPKVSTPPETHYLENELLSKMSPVDLKYLRPFDVAPRREAGLDMEIESHIASLKDDKMVSNRDASVNVEFV